MLVHILDTSFNYLGSNIAPWGFDNLFPNEVLKQLKDTWKCTSLADAKKKIKGYETEVEKLAIQIEEATEELEETYLNEE